MADKRWTKGNQDYVNIGQLRTIITSGNGLTIRALYAAYAFGLRTKGWCNYDTSPFMREKYNLKSFSMQCIPLGPPHYNERYTRMVDIKNIDLGDATLFLNPEKTLEFLPLIGYCLIGEQIPLTDYDQYLNNRFFYWNYPLVFVVHNITKISACNLRNWLILHQVKRLTVIGTGTKKYPIERFFRKAFRIWPSKQPSH